MPMTTSIVDDSFLVVAGDDGDDDDDDVDNSRAGSWDLERATSTPRFLLAGIPLMFLDEEG